MFTGVCSEFSVFTVKGPRMCSVGARWGQEGALTEHEWAPLHRAQAARQRTRLILQRW